jgi:hypothetical protein
MHPPHHCALASPLTRCGAYCSTRRSPVIGEFISEESIVRVSEFAAGCGTRVACPSDIGQPLKQHHAVDDA